MKLVLIISGFFLCSVLGMAQSNVLENKEYSVLVSEACKSYQDGGCLISTFHVLKFEKDSVDVSYYTKADCDFVEKSSSSYDNAGSIAKYSYQIHKKKNSSNYIVRIHGYRFGSLEVFPDHLIVMNPDHTNNREYIFKLIE